MQTIGGRKVVARRQRDEFINGGAAEPTVAGPPPIDDATILATFRQLAPEDHARVAGFIAGLIEARRSS